VREEFFSNSTGLFVLFFGGVFDGPVKFFSLGLAFWSRPPPSYWLHWGKRAVRGFFFDMEEAILCTYNYRFFFPLAPVFFWKAQNRFSQGSSFLV